MKLLLALGTSAALAATSVADIYQTWDCDGDGTILLTNLDPIPFVDLSNMYLGCADLDVWQKEPVDMTGANLSGSMIDRADLWFINLTGANLSGADLTETHLNHAILGNANFENANLNYAVFANAFMEGANFDNANLSDTGLTYVDSNGASFVGANLSSTWTVYGSFQYADFTGADFTLSQTNDAFFQHAIMSQADLTDSYMAFSNFSFVDFTNANMSYANFAHTILIDADFQGAKMIGISFDKIFSSDYQDTDVSGANFALANLTKAKMEDIVGWETAIWTAATYDIFTEFPPGMDPVAEGMVLVTVTLVVDVKYSTGSFLTVQNAIDFIDWEGAVEILLLPGVYTDIYQQVIDPKGLDLYIHSRDGAAVTIIDGSTNKRCVFVRTQETDLTVFEGLTFRNGFAQHGAGMWTSNSTPLVKDCVFEDNWSWGWGGGLYVSATGSPTLTNCVFMNNQALDGGAVKNYGNDPVFINCSFSGNTADNGGAVQNYARGATFTNCSFTSNEAAVSGGAIHNVFGSYPDFNSCTIEGNTAVNGGGIRNEATSVPVFTDCFIINNTATAGGGIENHNSSPSFVSCEIKFNVGQDVGGMLSLLKSNPSLLNSTVCDNSPLNIEGPFADLGGNTICSDATCDSDFNGDQVVDVNDLLQLIAAWGNPGGVEDLDQDGDVGVNDLLVLIEAWGACP